MILFMLVVVEDELRCNHNFICPVLDSQERVGEVMQQRVTAFQP